MSGACILVVEDNLMNRVLVRAILTRSGHEVIEAEGIPDARALLRDRLPDVILLDLQMPGGSGDQLLREIRADDRLKHLPVIAVTAYAMVGDRERLLEAGFDGYISKPISAKDFTQQVEAFLPLRTSGS